MDEPSDFQKRLNQRLGEVDWSNYFTVQGVAASVPEYLKRLNSENEHEHGRAKHDLWYAFFHEHVKSGSANLMPHAPLSVWCCICHEHVPTVSAALPALPFLVDMMESGSDVIKDSVLDIILGLTIATDPAWTEKVAKALGLTDPFRPSWIKELRSALIAELPRIEPLRRHPDPDISDFAQRICSDLHGKGAFRGV
jgi:hypothetical protein